MVIGIDFDNTIVCYDGVFHKVAVERGLVPVTLPATKSQIRDYLRAQGQEKSWIELQGYIYGARMLDATPFPGILEFLSWCKKLKIKVYIISHRTLYPFGGPWYDLHKAARTWLTCNGFYKQTGLSPKRVFFELTKQKKLNRIKQMGCDLFIDDLPEFLAEPEFPGYVRRILLDHAKQYTCECRFERTTSWQEVKALILKERTFAREV